ncbi:alpha/beta fold hydrolase [Fluviicola sp.]|uniref:alpha/beta fold hydrolase n=1 Tax=Fluviicola sp. TaxID=1917219 RepID=UPI0031D1B87E
MKNLIVLHGALGAQSQFEPVVSQLSEHFHVYTLEFDGHGKKSAGNADFSIEGFAQNLKDFMQQNHLQKPLVFGYSMGGYVALKLESQEANTFEKIVTLGTKFGWNPESAEKEAKMLNAEKIEEKVPAFAAYLKSLHGEQNWKTVLQRTAKMMLELGNKPALTADDFHRIQIPVQLLRGSKDIMVTQEETIETQSLLGNAGYREVEKWQHPVNQISPKELAQELLSSYLPG